MKANMGVAVKLHAFLISAMEGIEKLASCHGRYTPGESDSGHSKIHGLPVSVWTFFEKRKICCQWEFKRDYSFVQQAGRSLYRVHYHGLHY